MNDRASVCAAAGAASAASATRQTTMRGVREPERIEAPPLVRRPSNDAGRVFFVHCAPTAFIPPTSSSARLPAMTKRTFFALIVLVAAAFAFTGVGHAQAPKFKMEKFDIKGDGGTDYVSVEPATGRVFVSRGTHVMVVDGATGKVLGDIPNTPQVHGVGIATKAGHGFTTNGGDKSVVMFDLKTLAEIKRIPVTQGGLDGIMYDEPDDLIVLTNHSHPGTVTAINPTSGEIVGNAELEDNAPEGAVADGKGHIFVNNEGKSTVQVVDIKTWKTTASWSVAPCDGPTGIAYDKATNRIISGCSKTTIVLDATSGKIVAQIPNGTRVDALGYDPAQK